MQRKVQGAAQTARMGDPRNAARRLKSRWFDRVDLIDFRMFHQPFPLDVAAPGENGASDDSMRRIEPGLRRGLNRTRISGSHGLFSSNPLVAITVLPRLVEAFEPVCVPRGALIAFPSHLEEKS